MIDKNLDFYDDPDGSVLKARVPSREDVPEFIKQAERLNDKELDKLPDDVFALVALDSGEKMRKFACVDKGNAALSVIYFLENGHKLPEEAQKTAAANLMTACAWYDLAVPSDLEKVAKGKFFLRLSEGLKSMRRRVGNALHGGEGAAGGGLVGSRIKTSSAEAEKVALVGAAMGALTMAQGVNQGSKDFKARQQAMKSGVPAGQAFKMKAGELTGSNVMPYGNEPEKAASLRNVSTKKLDWKRIRDIAMRRRKRGAGDAVSFTDRVRDVVPTKLSDPLRKTAAMDPYVDITGKTAPKEIKVETGTRFALVKEGEARYPIDTASQVQRAFEYFEKHASAFEPQERRMYCLRVHNRAQELGMNSPDLVAHYGSNSMSKEAGVQIYRRQRLFRSGTSEHSLLQEMREKCASYKPEVMAVALEHFDKEHGLDRMWGNGLDDPYFSIFGIDKVAEWSFVDGNDTINEERLRLCAKTCKKQLEELFGDDMAEEFAENPIQIFDSLPLDSKRIIMRVGQQVEE